MNIKVLFIFLWFFSLISNCEAGIFKNYEWTDWSFKKIWRRMTDLGF
jgi:hypothetical protein